MPKPASQDLLVELVDIDSIHASPRNAREHSEEQVALIAGSIRDYGFNKPIVVDKAGEIIAGHGAWMAAKRLQLPKVPIVRRSHMNDVQKRAYGIADNRIALGSTWNLDTLRSELGDLRGAGLDLELLGFAGQELQELFAPPTVGKTDPDAAPPVPREARSKLGDVWLLGRHRLVCGDATVPMYVEQALRGAKPRLMVTDPPYGVEYDAAWRQRAGVGSEGAAVGKVLNDDQADWRKAWALFPGAVAYVWHAGTRSGQVADSLEAELFQLRAQIVWVKSRHVLSRGDYHHQHEPLFYGVRPPGEEHWHFVPEHEVAAYAVKKGAKGSFVGGRKQSTVWFIEHLQSDTGHSTQKPIECMRRPIENNSRPGDGVYEPFSGSGTTIIAGEMTGRTVYALELDPGYVDVAVLRWEQFTGQKARLEGALAQAAE